jgi:hypothetical protein
MLKWIETHNNLGQRISTVCPEVKIVDCFEYLIY